MEQMTSVLLQEIRGLREDLSDFKAEVASWRQDQGERLVKVETVVKPALMSNGQPSQISVLDARVNALEKSWGKVVAVASAAWGILTIALHYVPWGKH